jgi:hypothetical protein
MIKRHRIKPPTALKRKLIATSFTFLEMIDYLEFGATLPEDKVRVIERHALDVIAAVQQYRQSTNPLFTQGQKS